MSRMEKIKPGTRTTAFDKFFRLPRKRQESWTIYEWDLELCDIDGQVIEHIFATRLKDLKKHGEYGIQEADYVSTVPYYYHLNLTRDDRKLGGTKEWAYLNSDGTLPEEFDYGTKMPKRFLQEFERNREWASKYFSQCSCFGSCEGHNDQ